MAWTRRKFVAASALFGLTTQRGSAGDHVNDLGPDRLVLLGTRGGPAINGYVPSPSANLIVYKGVPYVIDAGYGATFKLIEAGVPLRRLRYIFITHHHSDHNLDLGPLLYNAWASGLSGPVDVFGPRGLNDLIEFYWRSNSYDIETRMSDEGRPDVRKLVHKHEFNEGPVFSHDAVTVSALRVIHPPVTEAYAFRFVLGRKIVVFSGDTAYFPPLADFAADADYLVHEVVYPPALDALLSGRPNVDPSKLKASILSHHTRPEDVGRIATRARAKTLVLNHFVPADDKALTPDVWLHAVRQTYSGRIVVGRDLLQLPL
jgi:ribonuclease BN (tRNA processing enzyme)